MGKLYFFLSSLFVFAALSACGVKGRPQPPLAPPVLGRGEPEFSDATQDLQFKKKTPNKTDDDFDYSNEFDENSSAKEENSK
jgi:hypothetical protein